MQGKKQQIHAAFIAVAIILSLVQLVHCGEPQRVTHKPGLIELKLPTATASQDITWEPLKPLDLDYRVYENGSVIVFYRGTPGQYVLTSDVIDWDARTRDKTSWIVTVEGAAPEPEPRPDDPPKPVDPDVKPAPVREPGLRVMVIYESGNLSILPSAQREILFNTNIRAWMTANCARVDNRPEWRFIDPDQPSPADTPALIAMFQRPRMTLPWLVISNGTKNTGYEGVLPSNADEMLRLLESHK